VSHIKTGKSLFANAEIINDYHIPVFAEENLRKSLMELLDKSQDEVSIKESKKNLKLIECLSPEKFLKKYQNKRNNDAYSSCNYNSQMSGVGTHSSMVTILNDSSSH
jgi:hypothetical protein